MRYATERRYSGNASVAFAEVEAILLPHGFRIIGSDSTKLELKGRGTASTKENPLRGATEVSIEAACGSLRLNATLGGVRSMVLFVCLFPVLLWGGLTVAAVLKSGDGTGIFDGRAIYGAVVWLIIGPAMAYWVRKRTTEALDDMLENASVIAERG